MAVVKNYEGPYAISMSGGGSKGAYHVGLVQYLWEVKKVRDFRVIYGTSTGALIAALFGAAVATDDSSLVQELIHIYSSVNSDDILDPHHGLAYKLTGEMGVLALQVLTGGESVFSTKPLYDLIDRYMTDEVWDKIIEVGQREENPIDIGFATVSMQTGQTTLVSNITHPDKETLQKAILASSTQPVFMPLVDMLGGQYVDGGVIDYNPVSFIFKSPVSNDVKTILALNLDPIDITTVDKNYEKIDEILLRTIQILTESVNEEDIKSADLWNVLLKVKSIVTNQQWRSIIDGLHPTLRKYVKANLSDKKYTPILSVAPKSHIDMNPLKFEQPAMKRLIRKGFRDGRTQFKDLT